jgi:dipeptidyl aminopeptidase/acylaminoacyl peptidase
MREVLRQIYLISLAVFLSQTISAQKSSLTVNSLKEWSSVGTGKISGDGNYISYSLDVQPYTESKTIITALNKKWQKEFKNVSAIEFTADNRYSVFRIADSLYVLELGTDNISVIKNIREYNISNNKQESTIAYMSNGVDTIVLLHLRNLKELRFPGKSYLLDNNGRRLIIEEMPNMPVRLKLVDLSTRVIKNIWSSNDTSEKIANYFFDLAGDRVGFFLQRGPNSKYSNELWYYSNFIDSSVLLLRNESFGDSNSLISSSGGKFSDDGKLIIFNTNPPQAKTAVQETSLDIWSYTDITSKSVQPATSFTSRWAVSLSERKLIKLTGPNERLSSYNSEYALVYNDPGMNGNFESYWNSHVTYSVYLVSLKDGNRKLLREHLTMTSELPQLSPNGKWIVYYNNQERNYLSFETTTGIVRNITGRCQTNWIDRDNDRLSIGSALTWPQGPANWIGDDEAILMNDNFDIWQIDPTGVKQPLNLTKSYGRSHHVKFQILTDQSVLKTYTANQKQSLLLAAVNKLNQDRGFYSATLNTSKVPVKLTMGPYVYGTWDGQSLPSAPYQKSSDSTVFLVTRSSCNDEPNYFITRDLKDFSRLTDVQAQKKFNWYTTELHTWKSLDGTTLQGVLYKPENFDSTKKYPVIFEYYENRSDRLNLYIFPIPGFNNAAFFASNGYLVFTPDIHYIKGQPGKSAYNAIVSAANYLSKYSFVDAKHMGIQGHSFGGYETNYIITHTNIFAAAFSSSGFCDLMSWYGSAARGSYAMYWSERDQGRIGVTPWQRPDWYINNSPIYYADKVRTPLLMMNNKGDKVVPFAQGLEFFTALRRLGKKVWMLQYNDEGHSLPTFSDNAIDHDLRLKKFFDHYLKDSACPKWMLPGFLANIDGTYSGLQLVKEKDKNGKWITPPLGGLLKDEKVNISE